MIISFLLQDYWILLSLQLLQPWTTSDYLMKHREEMAHLKIHLLKETTWSLSGEILAPTINMGWIEMVKGRPKSSCNYPSAINCVWDSTAQGGSQSSLLHLNSIWSPLVLLVSRSARLDWLVWIRTPDKTKSGKALLAYRLLQRGGECPKDSKHGVIWWFAF